MSEAWQRSCQASKELILRMGLNLLETSDVVLSYSMRIDRILWLTAGVVDTSGGEATSVKPTRAERSRGKGRLATLTRLPLCAGVCCKSRCDCRNGQASY